MRGVSRGFRRSAMLLALVTILVAQGAAAKGRPDGRGWGQRFERAKRFIIVVFGRFSNPPGQPVDDPAQIVPAESTPTTEE